MEVVGVSGREERFYISVLRGTIPRSHLHNQSEAHCDLLQLYSRVAMCTAVTTNPGLVLAAA